MIKFGRGVGGSGGRGIGGREGVADPAVSTARTRSSSSRAGSCHGRTTLAPSPRGRRAR
jgi:hypothetical protein